MVLARGRARELGNDLFGLRELAGLVLTPELFGVRDDIKRTRLVFLAVQFNLRVGSGFSNLGRQTGGLIFVASRNAVGDPHRKRLDSVGCGSGRCGIWRRRGSWRRGSGCRRRVLLARPKQGAGCQNVYTHEIDLRRGRIVSDQLVVSSKVTNFRFDVAVRKQNQQKRAGRQLCGSANSPRGLPLCRCAVHSRWPARCRTRGRIREKPGSGSRRREGPTGSSRR